MEFKRLYEPDHRGEIYRLTFDDGSFVNLIHTKAFKYRSGDIHPNIQHDLVLKGKVLFTLRENLMSTHEKDVDHILKENDKIDISEHMPHLFLSLTDSYVLEWWDGEFKADYYKPYRKIVDSQVKDVVTDEEKIDVIQFIKNMIEKENSNISNEERELLGLIKK